MTILHTNDFHGKVAGVAGALRPLRDAADLYLDSGDLVESGNLAIPLGPDAGWPVLAALRCDVSVPGNRDVHVSELGLAAKHKGRTTPVVCANLTRRDGSLVFPASVVLERGGLRVGVVGAMVPMVTPEMKTAMFSQFLWTSRIDAAVAEARRIRGEVDVLFALTHIGHRMDRELAETGAFDAIFGGHSHTVLDRPEKIGRTFIVQGGSHGRYAGVYEWRDGELTGGLTSLR